MPKTAGLAIALLVLASTASARTIRFENAHWFDGAAFVAESRWVQDGRFMQDHSAAPDETVDLGGAWVVPPLADAHTHAISDTPDPAGEAAQFVAAGILFMKNPNSTAGGVARGRRAIEDSGLPLRALYSGSGITSPGGHPSQIYEAHGADDGWLAVDSESAVAEVWPRLLAPDPDFVKIYLEGSENHAAVANDPAFRGARGLDPALVPAIVERARAEGLAVSAHVRTAADFRLAVEVGVDEINHLPLEELTDADAKRCAEQGIRVVTTVLSHRPTHGVTDLSALHRANLQRLQRAGVNLALGTDNGQVTVFDELMEIHELGALPGAELVRIATTASIRACLPADAAVGSLDPGQEATFLVLGGNPVEDPSAFGKIHSARVRGEILALPEASSQPESIVGPLIHIVMSEGIDAAIAAYHEWSRDRADEFDFSESQLNDLGYAMLAHGAKANAVRILQLNAEQFPHSVNAWDSLAEAQTAAGDLAGARKSSEVVLRRLEDLHDVEETFRQQLETSARERIAAGAE